MTNRIPLAILVLLVIPFFLHAQQKQKTVKSDPLPSWNTGTSKTAIIDFVTKTTKTGSTDFIPIADRIACFDNDGTLWSEQTCIFSWPLPSTV